MLPSEIGLGDVSAVCATCLNSLAVAPPPSEITPTASSAPSAPPQPVRQPTASTQRLMRCAAQCDVLGLVTADGRASAALAEHRQQCDVVDVLCVFGCGALVPRARNRTDEHMRMCAAVRIRCPGCAQLLPRSGLAAHWAVCQQLPVTCAQCDVLTPRGELGPHQGSTCSGRIVACADRCGVHLLARDQDAHSATHCMRARVRCGWGCGERIERQRMSEHHGQCDEVHVRCPGCSERVKRREMHTHWQHCARLPVLCDACSCMCLRADLPEHERSCLVLNPTPEPPPSLKFVCDICTVEDDLDGSFKADWHEQSGQGADPRFHRFHFECVANACNVAIERMGTRDDPVLRCPALDESGRPCCDGYLTGHEIQGLCRHGLREDLFDKFNRLTVRNLDGITNCPSECGWCAFNFNGQWLRCDKCTADNNNNAVWYCMVCHRNGHSVDECKHARNVACAAHRQCLSEQRDPHAEATRRLIAARTKQCPTCGKDVVKEAEENGTNCMRVRHNEGAGEFDCDAGGALFCWCCLADLHSIDEHDLSFHKQWCLKWTPPPPIASYPHRASCPACAAAGHGLFCDARPRTNCTRTSNGDFEQWQNTFCACKHGCPCDSPLVVRNTCTCGRTPDGQPIPSENCRCGGNQVVCGACDRTRCRLCARAPHPGYKCIEDRVPGVDPDPPDEVLAAGSSDTAASEDSDEAEGSATSDEDGDGGGHSSGDAGGPPTPPRGWPSTLADAINRSRTLGRSLSSSAISR